MIKTATIEDLSAIAKLAHMLWQEHTLENAPIGFAQCQLRSDYVEGTESSPVGYLEGIYVTEANRIICFQKYL